MPWYFYVLEFLGGMFLANGVPHFVQGISGHRFSRRLRRRRGLVSRRR